MGRTSQGDGAYRNENCSVRMNRLDLTRLNFRSPYQVWEGERGYCFKTDHGIFYTVYQWGLAPVIGFGGFCILAQASGKAERRQTEQEGNMDALKDKKRNSADWLKGWNQ